MPCYCCCFHVSRKKQASAGPYSRSVGGGGTGLSSDKNIKLFSYSELRSATGNFHRSNRIGRGGFGTVYKGTLRNGGGDVAVKVLSAHSRQGAKEFLTEIDVIANVRHPNLVALVGCCVEGDHRVLVYEHLRNGSLHRALLASSASGSGSDRSRLTWTVRRGVCVGVARGLAFLHEGMESGPVVHRDIKASNVLLDAGYGARIGDFGLARLFPDDATHVSTRVAGTPGYLAPEYAWHGQLTKKADVYSFGVLVLETVTGKSSSRSLRLSGGGADGVLVERVWELYEAGNLREMVDPAMAGDYGCAFTAEKEEEAVRYMKVALLCTQAAPLRRPSMPQVVEMLERDDVRVRETELTPPGFYVVRPNNSRQGSGSKSSDAVSSMLVASRTMTELAPR
uniref:Uncharacterized protein n=1 Tax=Avena sativa TaxID=4498 RepID=A0ACD6AEK2_AVESA